MIIVNADDRAYLLEKIPMAPLDSGTVRSVLLSIDDWLMTNGFAPPDYYDYSDEGRKMQKVRDRIYEDNVLNK